MNGAANIGNVANRIAMAIMAAGLAWCFFGFIAPGSAQSAPDSTAVVVYTVQPGDTLWRVCGEHHSGGWAMSEIRWMN